MKDDSAGVAHILEDTPLWLQTFRSFFAMENLLQTTCPLVLLSEKG
jgi:hypothetical protein